MRPPSPGQQVIEIDGRIVQDAMQEQIDALLSELAGKAELAARRSEEMMQQAEADAAQRLERSPAKRSMA